MILLSNPNVGVISWRLDHESMFLCEHWVSGVKRHCKFACQDKHLHLNQIMALSICSNNDYQRFKDD